MKLEAVQFVAAVYDRRSFFTPSRRIIGGHRPPLQTARNLLRLAALLIVTTTSGLAAATLSQQIDPPEISMGDTATVTYTLQNGNGKVELPQVDGLQVIGNSNATNISLTNGSFSSSFSQAFILAPTRPGDFTIPAFEIHTQDGQTLRSQPLKLHVLGTGASPSPSPSFNPSGTPSPSGAPAVPPPVNATAPPPPTPDNGNSADTNGSNLNVPMDSDGRPSKTFILITPKTTDAYVGETIPLRIEFYIRLDVDAPQNSLPTIKGSDFLMTSLSTRPSQDERVLANEPYHRYYWVTAISAPKSGDFALQMEHDTYWARPSMANMIGPFGNIFGSQRNLVHENIGSNQLLIHVHPLPEDGRPANFTGAIGQFKVTGHAEPESVAVGEPVTLRFTVSGEGNFDYIRCPSLAGDPAWKSYVPSSKTEYDDESRTQGTKSFEQAVIPQKNGNLPLPAASFSYFDSTTKQYVTLPISLPAITVTGSMPAVALAPRAGNGNSAQASQAPPQTSEFIPNRLETGSPQASLAPVYRRPWFWIVQGGLILFLLIGALILFFRSRRREDVRMEETLRECSRQQDEDAMDEAVRRGDARAFFLAARHAVQVRLGVQWHLHPEALTLAEIGQRDPKLAATLEPLFVQANEVIYSGQVNDDLDLAQWERRVRADMLQLQPA